MALSGPSWLGFLFFSCFAVCLSHSHSPGGMTVSYPIIPWSMIVLFYVLCVSLILSLNACCTPNNLVKPVFFFALIDRDRELELILKKQTKSGVFRKHYAAEFFNFSSSVSPPSLHCLLSLPCPCKCPGTLLTLSFQRSVISNPENQDGRNT